MLTILTALLPAISALQFPHIPTPQDALHAADSFLHGANPSSTKFSLGNDMTLASIPGDEHVLITSAHHPDHSIRIKSHHGWCDPDVRSYSGYLDVGRGDGRDLFFEFFESRGNPKEDPVLMWINGGPGCSSALGLFMELGPCSVKDDPKTVNDTQRNPHSWNNNANVFFLDEPIGVGFSYAEHHQTVSTTEQAAVDIAAFVSMFFEAFKEFEGRDFHMSGESYGGRYLPVFASAVLDNNAVLKKAGKAPVNLQSVLIGNGITEFLTTIESYYKFQCTIQEGREQTVQSIQACVAMAEALPRCHKMFTKGCLETSDYTTCAMASNYCGEMLTQPLFLAGVNPYDISKPCSLEELQTSLCYSVTDKISHYLDLPDTRALLGVDEAKKDKFTSCNHEVGLAFNLALDSPEGRSWIYVSNLLERGIKVLNYAGTFDFVCNHMGNEAWMENLEWSGKEGYNKDELKEWKVDGKKAGYKKGYKNLVLMKISGAGHMVPYDKPVEASAMLKEWLEFTRK